MIACPSVMAGAKVIVQRNLFRWEALAHARHSDRHPASVCRRRGGQRLHPCGGGTWTNPADDQPPGEKARGAPRSAAVQERRAVRIVRRGGGLLRLRKALASAA